MNVVCDQSYLNVCVTVYKNAKSVVVGLPQKRLVDAANENG